LWWQVPQFSLQYRAAQNGGRAPAAGLPRLFRAQAIKSLLPVVPGLPAPEIDLQNLWLDGGQNSDGSFDCWQPVLPGGLRYLIAGSRPGAMFAIRNMLLRQKTGSQNQALLTSGSLPVQHRMPRPVALPPNRPGRPEIALRTWSSYFEPEQSLAAGEQPVDEAYLAAAGNQPPVRLRAQLTGLERNTVATNWDGTLKFQYQVDGSTLSDWEVRIELTDGRQTLRYAPEDAQTKESFKPTDGSSQDLLRTLIAKAEPGSLLWVRMRASYTPAKDGFAQTLSYPLRVADVVSLPLPLAPRFAYFEDPEYNRRLASSSFHAEKLIKIPAGGKEQVTHKITLACDRREYTPDGRVALRFDWDDDASDDSRGSASFEIQRIDANGIPSGPLYLAGITEQSAKAGELRQFSLLDIQAAPGGKAVPFRAGEVLQVKLIVQPPAPSAVVPVVLAAKIISGPANPSPEAGYALLRSQKNGSGQVVECVRFAWSPDPARIELIAPEDLRTDLVRRRAVFQWSDTVRPDREVSYAVQKITASGSTHFPELAVG
jgi:hypothetical protein